MILSRWFYANKVWQFNVNCNSISISSHTLEGRTRQIWSKTFHFTTILHFLCLLVRLSVIVNDKQTMNLDIFFLMWHYFERCASCIFIIIFLSCQWEEIVLPKSAKNEKNVQKVSCHDSHHFVDVVSYGIREVSKRRFP